ncbi:MAG: WYL domain-containing protein [Lachnospiraceae bacterium]|nr:WYL domain-containing protein [Lachnospiraceae bacterium]
MYTPQPKKNLILNILDILRRYTDEYHTLTQKEIVDILQKEYGMSADRKAVRRNIQNLIECGYDIGYKERRRQMPARDAEGNPVINSETGEPVFQDNSICTDFYLKRDISDGELKLLIDQLLSLKYVPAGQCADLIHDLEGLTRDDFRKQLGYAPDLAARHLKNNPLFSNIEVLQEAIRRNRKVTFEYTEYRTDRQCHSRTRTDETVRIYKVTPYQMAAKDGKYYLICNYDKYNDVSNYRVDRIRELHIAEEQGKPFDQLDWSDGRRLNLDQYMAEHIYMFASKTSRARFRISKPLISDVIDLFGDDVWFFDETDTEVTVSALATEDAVEQFAKTYLPDVVILAPERLANKMQTTLEEITQKYRKHQEHKEDS